MTRHRFLVEQSLVAGATGMLDESRSRQVRSVLRLIPGDEITVFDGGGQEADATITAVDKRGVSYQVRTVAEPDREPPLDLTVGLALLRGDRFEIAIQKLTELGVRRIVPLAAERCVVSFRDARDWEKRAARFRRIIVEALEQSERVVDVVLDEPISLEAFVRQQPTIALVERADGQMLTGMPAGSPVALAIGPEGGWSERELAIIDRSADVASMGGLILRAETAAIVAAGILLQQSYSAIDQNQSQGDIQRGR